MMTNILIGSGLALLLGTVVILAMYAFRIRDERRREINLIYDTLTGNPPGGALATCYRYLKTGELSEEGFRRLGQYANYPPDVVDFLIRANRSRTRP